MAINSKILVNLLREKNVFKIIPFIFLISHCELEKPRIIENETGKIMNDKKK